VTPGPRGRNATIRRLLRLAKRLEGLQTRPSVYALAPEFGVHPRTIARDIALLEELYVLVPRVGGQTS
jgi:predicted DNA-binding transcriptional regulator YafY